MKRLLLAALVLAAAPAFTQDAGPVPPPAPKASPSPTPIQAANRAGFDVKTQVGAMTVTTSDAGTGLTPTLWADAEGPLVFGSSSIGRIGVRIGLTGTPGQAFNSADVTNYKGVETDARVARVVGVNGDIRTLVVAEYGITTLIKGSNARPLNGLVHSGGVGLSFEAKNTASLTLEGAFDEATTTCDPTINCSGLHSGFTLLAYGQVPIDDGKVLFGGDVSISTSSTTPGVTRRPIERIFVVVDPVAILKGSPTSPAAAASRSPALRLADEIRKARARG